MIFRFASVSDAPALAALHSESFGDAGWSAAQLADSLALPTTQCWAAVDGNVVQGFILCQRVGDDAEILTFCVARAARRQHLGWNLLGAAIDDARRTDARQMFLEVATDNQPALVFYEKAGFRITGKRANYYRRGNLLVDALMLALEL